MKNLNPALQAHLDSGTTTLAHCWKITRRDGEVMGFTEHDRDLSFDGLSYKAATGFTASAVQQSLGLNVDNMNVDGALSDDSITESDLANGIYDDAEVELWLVNWADTSQRVLMVSGNVGEVKRFKTAFSTEVRSLAHRMNQRVGRTYSRTCDTTLGSAKCGKDLSSFQNTATVTGSTSSRRITVSLSGTARAKGFFSFGVVEFTSGPLAGQSYEVRNHYVNAGVHTLEMWDGFETPPSAGVTLSVTAGCDKVYETCRDKFANAVNFQGFPGMPGNDVLTLYPTRGETTVKKSGGK